MKIWRKQSGVKDYFCIKESECSEAGNGWDGGNQYWYVWVMLYKPHETDRPIEHQLQTLQLPIPLTPPTKL